MSTMKLLAILPVFSAGCFVMTGTTSTKQRLAGTLGDEQEGVLQALQIQAQTGQGEVLLAAHTHRTCTRDHLGIYETRTSKHLRLGGADDPRAKVFGLALAPVTLPVSFIASGLSVLAGDPEPERDERVESSEVYACTPPAAALDIAITLPSGAHASVTTDVDGKAGYTIPATEPYEGTLILHAEQGGVETTTALPYSRPLPAEVSEVVQSYSRWSISEPSE